jgi:hypothetical protein
MAKTTDNTLTLADTTRAADFDFGGIPSDKRDLVAKVDASAITLADGLAGILADSERILDYCRIAYEGMKGWTEKVTERREVLAIAATARLAVAKFPHSEDAAVEQRNQAKRALAWTKPANHPDGATVSGTGIAHRAAAYGDVIDLGLEPTAENVKEAFRLTSTGGSKEHRETRDSKVKDGADFITATDAEMKVLLKKNSDAKKKKAQEQAAKAQASKAVEFDAEKGTAANVVFALQWADQNIARFSDEERSAIEKAAKSLMAHFAPVSK